MAEGLFRKMTEQRETFIVGSAGISAVDGFMPTAETVRAMQSEGVDVTGHRSRRLTLELIRRADRILVMETMHKEAVLRLCPEVSGKIFLLSEFSPDPVKMPRHTDIPDPIRMSDTFYARVLAMIRDCLEGFLKSFQENE